MCSCCATSSRRVPSASSSLRMTSQRRQDAEALIARRERFGLSYLVTPDRDLPALTTIIASR